MLHANCISLFTLSGDEIPTKCSNQITVLNGFARQIILRDLNNLSAIILITKQSDLVH